MKMRFLSVIAVLLLVTGCAGLGKGGAGADSSISGREIIPGTAEDFIAKANDRIFFDYDRSNLNAEAKEVLKAQALWLKTYGEKKVVIEGHCDERGTREYNLALGERRANEVKKFLIAQGVEVSRVKTISYGKERPAVIGSNDAAWAQNRRAVSVVE